MLAPNLFLDGGLIAEFFKLYTNLQSIAASSTFLLLLKLIPRWADGSIVAKITECLGKTKWGSNSFDFWINFLYYYFVHKIC